jgi:methylthioribulose-1-phosphate dehydratase
MPLLHDDPLAHRLVETILSFNLKGWSPATSTNYSVRSNDPDQIIISRSGVDKNSFSLKDLILVDLNGELIPPYDAMPVKPSAETGIHTYLYQRDPETKCVLHTHSPLGTVLSLTHLQAGELVFEGYEILKGLSGNTTHEMKEIIPVVPNSQDMAEIIAAMEPRFARAPKLHGFLIAGHGLYTWGKDLAEAKRHVETFEFLFDCARLHRSL